MSQTDTATRQQILELGQRWAEAERRCDAAALEQLLHEQFIGVGPLGFVLDKRQWVEPRRAGLLKHTSFQWQDPSVRVFGDTALVVAVQEQQTTYQDRNASGRFRVTQILARAGEGDPWLIAGMHLSPIAAPPGS
jgi:ketosteroid isomerase-like protein